jgi:ubiquinone biosynthesis protein
METQPQLLLLQKTMVLVEGVGRRLEPNINIWTLARPLIEAWMFDNRGPEARLRRRLETVAETIERLPQLVANLDRLVDDMARDGVVLHAETLAAHAAEQARRAYLAVIPLWLAAAALVAIAIALLVGR